MYNGALNAILAGSPSTPWSSLSPLSPFWNVVAANTAAAAAPAAAAALPPAAPADAVATPA